MRGWKESMLRNMTCAVAFLAFGFTVASAGELFATIKKVTDKEISVTKFKRGDKKGKDAILNLADNVKVVKAKIKKGERKVEAGDELEGGLKNPRFQKIDKGGVFAHIITNDEGQVTEIQVFPGGFKGKGKN